jgi:hypothetical protein
MKARGRQKRAIQTAKILTEKINAMLLSGLRPLDHPDVRKALDLFSELPDAAKPLQQRQGAIEYELQVTFGFHAADLMTLKVLEDGPQTIPLVAQDPRTRLLLEEYSANNEKIIMLLESEGK